jgi:hypothetical protein
MAEGQCEALVWNLGLKIEIPHPENHVLKVFRFRSWKPRVWKSRPQSWDPKAWKPCPENHILKFSRPQSWDPKSRNGTLGRKKKKSSCPSRSRNLDSGPRRTHRPHPTVVASSSRHFSLRPPPSLIFFPSLLSASSGQEIGNYGYEGTNPKAKEIGNYTYLINTSSRLNHAKN